jgi:hypothetical protein
LIVFTLECDDAVEVVECHDGDEFDLGGMDTAQELDPLVAGDVPCSDTRKDFGFEQGFVERGVFRCGPAVSDAFDGH